MSVKDGVGVRALKPLGAVVSGFSVAESGDEEFLRLRRLLSEYQLLILPGQELSPPEQIRLTRGLGELDPGIRRRPESHQVPGYPDVLFLNNRTDSPTAEYGMSWHSDGLAYARVPHGATILHCRECPSGVGDTLFADQYAAYSALPSRIKESVSGAHWYLPEMPFSEVPQGRGLIRPMVRVHPFTGKTFLYFAPQAELLRNRSYEESAEVLDTIRAAQVRDEHVYGHSWSSGDTVIWENCTLLHNRADRVDFERHGLRVMHRTATAGDLAATECEAPPTRERDSG